MTEPPCILQTLAINNRLSCVIILAYYAKVFKEWLYYYKCLLNECTNVLSETFTDAQCKNSPWYYVTFSIKGWILFEL